MDMAWKISSADGWVQRREQRHKVLIRARMRAGGLPVEVCISDVSPHGICCMTATAPARGTIVEVTDIACPLVGQVVWSSQRRFGIAVRDKIEMGALMAQSPAGTRVRNVTSLPTSDHKPAAPQQRQSRDTGSAMQFTFVATAVAIAALLIGNYVYDYLSIAAVAVVEALRTAR
jgi:hypothetical protein